MDFCINYMESLGELIHDMQKLKSDLQTQLPVFIKLFVSKAKLPYMVCDISYEITKIKSPKFCFLYVSPAGKSSCPFEVEVTSSMLRNIRTEINNKLGKTEHSKAQRSAMTNDLREAIKKRDNYTCCLCGNSVYTEPNLLLEVDHIIPVSKGGKTEANNLQTLCWRCNRRKSNS